MSILHTLQTTNVIENNHCTLNERRSGSRSASSSASSLNIFPTFDRHLVLIGCQTFQDFFDLHPQVLKNFDQYEFIKINEGITCADALKMHASRVLALGEDIVNNSGNPDKIRSLLQDLGKHHCQQVGAKRARIVASPHEILSCPTRE